MLENLYTNPIGTSSKNGKQFNAWTLNTKEEIEMAIQLDIDSYFTNYTDMAFELEMKYRIS